MPIPSTSNLTGANKLLAQSQQSSSILGPTFTSASIGPIISNNGPINQVSIPMIEGKSSVKVTSLGGKQGNQSFTCSNATNRTGKTSNPITTLTLTPSTNAHIGTSIEGRYQAIEGVRPDEESTYLLRGNTQTGNIQIPSQSHLNHLNHQNQQQQQQFQFQHQNQAQYQQQTVTVSIGDHNQIATVPITATNSSNHQTLLVDHISAAPDLYHQLRQQQQQQTSSPTQTILTSQTNQHSHSHSHSHNHQHQHHQHHTHTHHPNHSHSEAISISQQQQQQHQQSTNAPHLIPIGQIENSSNRQQLTSFISRPIESQTRSALIDGTSHQQQALSEQPLESNLASQTRAQHTFGPLVTAGAGAGATTATATTTKPVESSYGSSTLITDPIQFQSSPIQRVNSGQIREPQSSQLARRRLQAAQLAITAGPGSDQASGPSSLQQQQQQLGPIPAASYPQPGSIGLQAQGALMYGTSVVRESSEATNGISASFGQVQQTTVSFGQQQQQHPATETVGSVQRRLATSLIDNQAASLTGTR